ncbi:hypothetical protein THRCLA_22417 [Thraustotheca clavata]|uniref:Uncharacterized protein n=1 Tax=Thraustotheca clavata TaxID=74557 RepID=A0A1V9Z1Z2_9STRA|nr:hypothetical protein THRCLA_22417 [Thraustotheca clavata]
MPKNVVIVNDYLVKAASGLHLRFYKVRLDDMAFERIVQTIKTNPKIKSLSLCDLGCGPKLAVLIANVLEINTTLTSVDLSGNEIGTHGSKCLAAAIRRNKTLQKLSLQRCGLSTDCIAEWAELMKRGKHHTFHTFDLSHNEICDDGALLFAKTLANADVTLQGWKIKLTKNKFTDVGIKALADLMENNQSIVQLDVATSRSFGLENIENVVFLEHKCRQNMKRMHERVITKTIQAIYQSTRLGENVIIENKIISVTEAVSLAHALRTTLATISLTLRNNTLSLAATEHLAKGLIENNTLYKLALVDNGITGTGVWAILQAIAQHPNPSLRCLEIANSTSMPLPPWTRRLNGFYYRYFTQFSRLTQITLNHCGLLDDDIGVLVAGMAWGCNMELVHVARNKFTDRILPVFELLLHRCQSFESLDISGNQCTLSGVVSLVEKASQHQVLHTLLLGRFAAFDTSFRGIATLLHGSNTITRFDITAAKDHSKWTPVKAEIQSILLRNRALKNKVHIPTLSQLTLIIWTRRCRLNYVARDLAHNVINTIYDVNHLNHIVEMKLMAKLDENVSPYFFCMEMAMEDISATFILNQIAMLLEDINILVYTEFLLMQAEDFDIIHFSSLSP